MRILMRLLAAGAAAYAGAALAGEPIAPQAIVPTPIPTADPATVPKAIPASDLAPQVHIRPRIAPITLAAGIGQVVHLAADAANVFTADPKIAEVRPASADSLFVFGVAPGTTTVAALTSAGDTLAKFTVTVVPSSFTAAQARAAIPGATALGVTARQTDTGVSLGGTVPSPGQAERAVNAAKGALPPGGTVDNEMRVAQPIEVSLHVRIAEMNRTLVRELGVNWSAATLAGNLTGNGNYVRTGVATATSLVGVTGLTPTTAALGYIGRNFNLEAMLDALSNDQLIHVLAEPNLTAMSGEPAEFLAGGEFPIPVATQNNTISLEFKQYGISLAFVPTVIANDQISLHVRPEVSQLDKANGISFLLSTTNAVGIVVPALTVRRADTTVQLGSGQSFVIAGLLQDQTTVTGNAVPGLGDVPILGALFRSDSFQRNESELVIVVTPYIVKPVSDPNALKLPTDGWRPPNDIERILLLRQSARGMPGPAPHVPADAGFMVE